MSKTIACSIAWLIVGVFACYGAESSQGHVEQVLEIRSVVVDGKSIVPAQEKPLVLPSRIQSLSFYFGYSSNSIPQRIRYRLEGYDNGWIEYPRNAVSGEMWFSVRFLNNKGDPVGESVFKSSGQSEGWTGEIESSPFRHRKEIAEVPKGAASVWIAMSSAGPPSVLGVWAITNVSLTITPSNGQSARKLVQFPPGTMGENTSSPAGWMPDGTHASMAKVLTVSRDQNIRALVIMDEDAKAHAEWHTVKGQGASVAEGERLTVEWDEVCTVGLGDPPVVTYNRPPAGFYRFHINGLTVAGLPTEAEAWIAVEVPLPIWHTAWFWGIVIGLIISGAVGADRYNAWRRLRRDLERLESQRALERERVRIAQDIHDDLGARVTQISLISGMALREKSLSEKARGDFDAISRMSRELVSALYETVWAVNPENDNLDALGNYICQMVDNLCGQAQLRCRLNVAELPPEIQVSSQVRHNLAMATKEAVHNVVKHAQASEVAVQVVLENSMLTIRVQDDGKGFDPSGRSAGNGLANMRGRMERIGGSCSLSSAPGKGTIVGFTFTIPQSPTPP